MEETIVCRHPGRKEKDATDNTMWVLLESNKEERVVVWGEKRRRPSPKKRRRVVEKGDSFR